VGRGLKKKKNKVGEVMRKVYRNKYIGQDLLGEKKKTRYFTKETIIQEDQKINK
jgi:hypothetical protein